MSIPEVADGARKYLKGKPSGGDTGTWIGIRTILDAFTSMGGMGCRVRPLLELIEPELSGTFLDVGCYGGWVYPLVREKVTYSGIDDWPDAIECARKLFGPHFELCDLRKYRKQHDIVWATQLHPTLDVRQIFEHLQSLANRMLVITYAKGSEAFEGAQIVDLDGVIGAIYRK